MDTVGFIQDLPTALIHSFRATLDEVKRADVLLHVRDASSTPRVSEVQRLAVEETLRELGASEIPTLEVWNKADKEQDREEGEEGDEEEVHGELSSRSNRIDSSSSCSSNSDTGEDVSISGVDGGQHEGVEDDDTNSSPLFRVQKNSGVGDANGSDMRHPDNEEERRHHRHHRAAEGKGTEEGSRVTSATGDNSSDCTILPSAASGPAASANTTMSMEPRGRNRGPATATMRDDRGGVDNDDAVRVSAATGDGLKELLRRVDALLHLGGNARLAPPPSERFRYVQTLPGQQLHK